MNPENQNTTADLGWIHHYESGSNAMTLLLLHGTGGDETSLLPIGRKLAPKAALLSPRGRSLEEGSPRFFRRYSVTKYDQAHLIQEADALATFVADACCLYHLDPTQVLALGFSNGANIAVASLVRHPTSYAAAALLRPVMPFDEPPSADLAGKRILITNGAHDPFLPHAKPLVSYLRSLNADVQEELLPAGHELTQQDLTIVSTWLAQSYSQDK